MEGGKHRPTPSGSGRGPGIISSPGWVSCRVWCSSFPQIHICLILDFQLFSFFPFFFFYTHLNYTQLFFLLFFLYIFFLAFYGFIDRSAEDMTGNRERERERGSDTQQRDSNPGPLQSLGTWGTCSTNWAKWRPIPSFSRDMFNS